jgi:alkylated DNA repair dioxygenase AlkB
MSSPTPSIFDDLPPIRPEDTSDSEISIDSLFDEPQAPLGPKNSRIPYQTNEKSIVLCPAHRSLESEHVPGIYYDQRITVSPEIEAEVIDQCLRAWFVRPGPEPHTVFHLNEDHFEFNNVNQVMLFNRTDGITPDQSSNSSWPKCLTDLLIQVSQLLKPPGLDPEIWDLLFSTSGGTREERETGMRSRQAIINLYRPGEGISDHIDLLDRYGDGIVGISFGSGCVMRFRYAEEGGYQEAEKEVDERSFTQLYLPPRSVIIITGEARFKWTHGIPGRVADLVEGADTQGLRIARGMRLSVTFRWLLPGADIVGTA